MHAKQALLQCQYTATKSPKEATPHSAAFQWASESMLLVTSKAPNSRRELENQIKNYQGLGG